jgi:hypothetical protein
MSPATHQADFCYGSSDKLMDTGGVSDIDIHVKR